MSTTKNLTRAQVNVLVLTGDGINCERETAGAFKELGAKATIVHIADLIETPMLLEKAHIFVLPGGFSFGDEIGSGQILALKLKHSLGSELKKFIEEKKIIIGICNGFQALVRLGFLPRPHATRSMTLTHNRQGHFIDRWVDLKVPASACVWTKKIQGQTIALPIRHGEGRIVFSGDQETQRQTYQGLVDNKQIALEYAEDVNGSFAQIAGVTDTTGRIFGLMPHPEVAISGWHNPAGGDKSARPGIGLAIFESGIEYCENNL